MNKTLFLSLLMVSTLAHASIESLVSQLAADDLSVQTQAQIDLLAECSYTGRPGAEAERKAICLEMCAVLQKGCPLPAATQLVRNLQRIGGEESVDTLVPMLGNSDANLRDDVRQALAVNPAPAAGLALQAQLKMRKAREVNDTVGLITALGERREAGASALVAAHIGSSDMLIFTAAAKALALINEPDGIRALAQERVKAQGDRKAILTAVLFETGRTEVFRKLYEAGEPEEVRAVALIGLVLNKEDNVAAAAMASGNPGLQCAVIEAASQTQEGALYSLLAKNLDSLPPHLQVQALGVLQFSGDSSSSPAIVSLLSSGDGNVQNAAAQALGSVGTADAVPALLALGSGAAKEALGVINAKGVDETLIKAAKSGGGEPRAVAIEALALRGRVQLMDLFFSCAANSDQQVAKAGVQAINMLGRDEDLKPAVALMLANEKSPLSRDIQKAIVSILRRSSQQQAAVAVLVGAVSGASPKGQVMILQTLAQEGGNDALASVAKAAKSNNAALSKEAVKLLGNWPEDNALPVLLEIAGDSSTPLTEHVLAMRGVSRLLAGQKNPDTGTAEKALKVCRRDEEREQIRDLLDAQQGKEKKKKKK